MANTKQARKRARQNITNRTRNKWQKTRANTAIKSVLALVEGKQSAEAKTAYQSAVSLIDRLVSKGIIHKNKAARHKSRLNAKIKAVA